VNSRERFLAIAQGDLRGEAFLPLNLNYGWFMPETLDRWRSEGLPEGVDLAEYFGFERVAFSGGGPYSLHPPFEVEVLGEDAQTRTIRDEAGVVKRIFKDNEQSKMPQWLDYPVKTREDFHRLQERLDPSSPARYPADWAAFRARWDAQDCPRGLAPGSFYGHTLQRWVGTEHLCMLFYDDPGLVHEMLEYLEWFFLQLVEPYLREVPFEFASFGEDIAYKGRSFLSPAMFREFIQPHYVTLCERMRAHGIEVIFVDSDGCIDELIPLWLEVGINAFSPLEVAAGTDALALKHRYGREIVLAGNIDKRALAKGRDAIDAEVNRARALMALGGYFPAVDHSVPPDVSLEAFQYLVAQLRAGA
jgi:uroporphyrinogen decarboxylase